jgi:hypothetical protein
MSFQKSSKSSIFIATRSIINLQQCVESLVGALQLKDTFDIPASEVGYITIHHKTKGIWA